MVKIKVINLQEKIIILKSIAKKIANKLHCDRHGSCVHFAEIFVDEVNKQYPDLLNDFEVIEGYVNVKFGDGIPQEHTWIKLSNGDIIDPTFSQFDKYDKNAQYSKKRTKVYSGREYYDEGKEGSWFSERRKKLPGSVFKKGLQESIRRILREEIIEDKNLYGEKLKMCSTNPMTGFYRDGYCRTGDDDTGSHTVCAKVTEEFLEFTNSMGNNLYMLEPGDKWCLCAMRWKEAKDNGIYVKVDKSATNIKTLDII